MFVSSQRPAATRTEQEYWVLIDRLSEDGEFAHRLEESFDPNGPESNHTYEARHYNSSGDEHYENPISISLVERCALRLLGCLNCSPETYNFEL